MGEEVGEVEGSRGREGGEVAVCCELVKIR